MAKGFIIQDPSVYSHVRRPKSSRHDRIGECIIANITNKPLRTNISVHMKRRTGGLPQYQVSKELHFLCAIGLVKETCIVAYC